MGFTDKQMLDFVESLWNENLGLLGWVLRESSTGRGYRLHTTSRVLSFKTAREAISNVMLAEKEAPEDHYPPGDMARLGEDPTP